MEAEEACTAGPEEKKYWKERFRIHCVRILTIISLLNFIFVTELIFNFNLK